MNSHLEAERQKLWCMRSDTYIQTDIHSQKRQWRLDLNISETGCSQLSVHDIRVKKDISQNINNPRMTVDHTMGCITYRTF